MEIETLTKQAKLAKYLGQNPKLAAFAAGLKKLRQLGQTNAQIEDVIRKADLPLREHLFLTGNFSDLMALRYPYEKCV